MKRLILLLFACFIFSGCASSISNTVHHSVKNQPQKTMPKTLLMLPVDITIKELTASGLTEEVPEWTKQGKAIVNKLVREHLSNKANITLQTLPEMSDQTTEIVDQHVALYDQVAANAHYFGKHEAWKEFREKEGYTLGNGLASLKDQVNADAVLIITGADFISSSGRQGLAILAAMGGSSIRMGHSILHAGVVDMDTGNLLWMNTSFSQTYSLNKEEQAKHMVDTVFENYMVTKK